MGDFIFNEIVTFELTKDEVESIYKPVKKRAIINYVIFAVLFAALTAVAFALELPIIPWVLLVAITLGTIVYIFTVLKIDRELKKQLSILDIKRYNFALYLDELVVTVKDDVAPFNEYIVPIDDVNAKLINGIWTLRYKGRVYALPVRVLREKSRYYKHAR